MKARLRRDDDMATSATEFGCCCRGGLALLLDSLLRIEWGEGGQRPDEVSVGKRGEGHCPPPAGAGEGGWRPSEGRQAKFTHCGEVSKLVILHSSYCLLRLDGRDEEPISAIRHSSFALRHFGSALLHSSLCLLPFLMAPATSNAPRNAKRSRNQCRLRRRIRKTNGDDGRDGHLWEYE